jgi:microcin C transport system substrate-binding protein
MLLRAFFLFALLIPVYAQAQAVTDAEGIALHGDVKYKSGWPHLDYVNPDAPKGGELRLAVVGGFDSLQPYLVKGDKVDGLGLVYQTLMESTLDEPNSSYGLVASGVTYPEDRSKVSFKLRPEAKFNDGSPITVEDIIWSFNTLREKGIPHYRSYYRDVAKVEKTGPHEITFIFSKVGNTELPFIIGQLPIIPKSDWVKKKFEETTLQKPMGSGPYEVESVDPGHSITYVRVKNWWGAALPINKGRYNFDRIRYDYYRDPTVLQEAFLAGRFDFKAENIAKSWATAYKSPAITAGQIVKKELPNQLPSGMQAFVYNTRRPIFSDPLVREALAYAFDFEWANKNLAYSSYVRTRSYFDNSELESTSLPTGKELEILNAYRDKLPERVFTQEYNPPKTDGSGNTRDNMRKAMELLNKAGWKLQNSVLMNAKGEAFKFEFMSDSPAFERWVQPFMRNLEKLGIKVNLRIVDSAQYVNRMNDFDFDMTITVFAQSLSPGNEQMDFWGSSKADVKGSKNYAGIKNPVIDELVEGVIRAKGMDELKTYVHALDRVLQWGFYVIPNWHFNKYRLAYWDIFGTPAINPPYGLPVDDAWWVDTAKAAKINAIRSR